jgi:hypothetical protein
MYVEGCPVVRDPSTVNKGLAGGPASARWAVGAYSWAGELDKTWIGDIGDIRIVSRPLDQREFMISWSMAGRPRNAPPACRLADLC